MHFLLKLIKAIAWRMTLISNVAWQKRMVSSFNVGLITIRPTHVYHCNNNIKMEDATTEGIFNSILVPSLLITTYILKHIHLPTAKNRYFSPKFSIDCLPMQNIPLLRINILPFRGAVMKEGEHIVRYESGMCINVLKHIPESSTFLTEISFDRQKINLATRDIQIMYLECCVFLDMFKWPRNTHEGSIYDQNRDI